MKWLGVCMIPNKPSDLFDSYISLSPKSVMGFALCVASKALLSRANKLFNTSEFDADAHTDQTRNPYMYSRKLAVFFDFSANLQQEWFSVRADSSDSYTGASSECLKPTFAQKQCKNQWRSISTTVESQECITRMIYYLENPNLK